jgi:hypothetical protein
MSLKEKPPYHADHQLSGLGPFHYRKLHSSKITSRFHAFRNIGRSRQAQPITLGFGIRYDDTTINTTFLSSARQLSSPSIQALTMTLDVEIAHKLLAQVFSRPFIGLISAFAAPSRILIR